MDWQMLGAIGEVLGAVAVFATLLYLSQQVRAGNALAHERRQQELHDRSDGMLATMTSSTHIAGVYRRGIVDDGSLNEDEEMQFRLILLRWSYLVQRIYRMDLDVGVDPGMMSATDATVRWMTTMPGFRKWYATARDRLDPVFCGVLDRFIEESPQPTALEGPQQSSDAER